MYRLMIVEDEPIERQGIHLMLTNGLGGMLEICEAADGYEAVRQCREFQPHIVMIDIHMPGMNGLETIVELRRIDSAIRFVILTSHDKFKYAHEAIRLGVEDFILKPAGIARLRESIGSVIDKLEHDKEENSRKTALLERMESVRPILERDCVYTLTADRSNSVTAEDFRFLDFEVRAGICMIIKSQSPLQALLMGVKQALARIGVHCIGEVVDDQAVLFALFETTPEVSYIRHLSEFVLQQIRQRADDGVAHAGVSGISQTRDGMQALYAQAGTALREAIAQGKACCAFHELEAPERQESEIEQALVELRYAVAARDTFQQKTLALAQQIVRQKEWNDAAAFLNSLAERFALWLHTNNSGQAADTEPEWSSLRRASSNEALALAFQTTMESLTRGIYREGTAYSNSQVGQILAYIEQNYMKNLSLDSIAEQFSITPFYLSRLIKKKIGKSFPDLLADCRIRNAKRLLQRNKSIKEVTYEVGFSSQNYFGKTFKKITGETPTDYKEKYR